MFTTRIPDGLFVGYKIADRIDGKEFIQTDIAPLDVVEIEDDDFGAVRIVVHILHGSTEDLSLDNIAGAAN